MAPFIGKIASNGRVKIVIDHVVTYASGEPFAFCGCKIGMNGTAGQSREMIQASKAKISLYLNDPGARA